VQLVNVYNLTFLLVVNPLARSAAAHRPAGGARPRPPGLQEVGFCGVHVAAWRSTRPGLPSWPGRWSRCGAATSSGVSRPARGSHGHQRPYRMIRHPMYAAVLLISFGLACLTQSLIGLAVFGVYLVPDPSAHPDRGGQIAERVQREVRRLPTRHEETRPLRVLSVRGRCRTRRERPVRVLTVYAHQDPKSFVTPSSRSSQGGSSMPARSEVVDLYAIRFDPVFGCRTPRATCTTACRQRSSSAWS